MSNQHSNMFRRWKKYILFREQEKEETGNMPCYCGKQDKCNCPGPTFSDFQGGILRGTLIEKQFN